MTDLLLLIIIFILFPPLGLVIVGGYCALWLVGEIRERLGV